VSYKYDALGRRIQRTPSIGVSTNFVYDGAEVVKDINSDGSTVEYLNGPGVDNKLRLTDSRLSGPLYFVQDHLGSTTGFTNSTGSLVSEISYDSFGNANSGTNLTRYTYTGREFDSDTGLYYYRARWYDAKVGRFISEDPIGFGGGVNQFAYVRGNPTNRTDPSGLYEIDVHYYLTYYLALRTGCFKDWEAHEIANEDQGTDEDEHTRPGYGDTEQQRMQNRIYHALHPGAIEGVGSPLLWRGAMNETGGHKWIGRYLHYLQDTFSHAGYGNDVSGHSPLNAREKWGDHSNDKTASDPARARRMAGATWQALVDYAKAKQCGCSPKWDASWWSQINDFIHLDTDYPRSSTIDALGQTLENPGFGDPAALIEKRRILGLLDRYSGEW
jgi:RHS repeat-associated protein